MPFSLLADLLVCVHLAFVGFVVGGEVLVVIGGWAGWRWVRERRFRVAHLAAIVAVAVEAVFGWVCPLTSWEWALRRRAGQSVEEDIPFIGRLLRDLLYWDLPSWAFTIAYVSFAALVIATLVVVPVRWRATRPAPGG